MVAVALSALLTSGVAGPDVMTLHVSRSESCAQLRAGLPGDSPDMGVETTPEGCALRLPGTSAWSARPEWLGELLLLSGFTREQQAALDLLMDRLSREGRIPELHLFPSSTPALVRAQDSVDEFNRSNAANTGCACARATLEQSRGWVGWSVRPTGNCGNGLLAGDAPAWCPESARFVPMTVGVAGVLVVVLALVVRRAILRRAARAAKAGGSASP